MTLLTLLRAENLSLRQALWLKAEEVDRLSERLKVAEGDDEIDTEGEGEGEGEVEVEGQAEVQAEGAGEMRCEEVRDGDVDADVDVDVDVDADADAEMDKDRDKDKRGAGKRGKEGRRVGLGVKVKVERLEARTEGLERTVGELCRRWVGEWEAWVGERMGLCADTDVEGGGGEGREGG